MVEAQDHDDQVAFGTGEHPRFDFDTGNWAWQSQPSACERK